MLVCISKLICLCKEEKEENTLSVLSLMKNEDGPRMKKKKRTKTKNASVLENYRHTNKLVFILIIIRSLLWLVCLHISPPPP